METYYSFLTEFRVGGIACTLIHRKPQNTSLLLECWLPTKIKNTQEKYNIVISHRLLSHF